MRTYLSIHNGEVLIKSVTCIFKNFAKIAQQYTLIMRINNSLQHGRTMKRIHRNVFTTLCIILFPIFEGFSYIPRYLNNHHL